MVTTNADVQLLAATGMSVRKHDTPFEIELAVVRLPTPEDPVIQVSPTIITPISGRTHVKQIYHIKLTAWKDIQCCNETKTYKIRNGILGGNTLPHSLWAFSQFNLHSDFACRRFESREGFFKPETLQEVQSQRNRLAQQVFKLQALQQYCYTYYDRNTKNGHQREHNDPD